LCAKLQWPGDAKVAPLERELDDGLLNLKDCLPGSTVTVCSISPDLGCAQRLRELGIVEGSQVLLIKQEDPVLLVVKDSRIAIDPSTARQITVSRFSNGIAPASNGKLDPARVQTVQDGAVPAGENGR
jgi:Fe2+ transport system protein FeoA